MRGKVRENLILGFMAGSERKDSSLYDLLWERGIPRFYGLPSRRNRVRRRVGRN